MIHSANGASAARWPLLGLVLLLLGGVGCATTRTVTIVTKPEDARIKINGVDRGVGPVTETLTWRTATEVHRVEVDRMGYRTRTEQLTRDDKRKLVEIELPVHEREIHFTIHPVPGILKINGEQVTPEPVPVRTERLQFTVDSRRNWTNYIVTAERPNFKPAQVNVTWTDNKQMYDLYLEPLSKDLNISSSPSGAAVFIDGEQLGTTPLLAVNQPFPFNPDTNEFEPRVLRLEKAGYDPVEMEISWDEGQSDYELNLREKQKIVRITTDPPHAEVTIEGVEPERRDGVTVYNLAFPPENDAGELRVYAGVARVTPGEREWEPAFFEIAWDDGQTNYHLELTEILTRPVPLLAATIRRDEQGWVCVPELQTTLAMKDKSEPPGHAQPVLIHQPGAGKSIGSIAVAPDGRKLLFTELIGTSTDDFRSQMFVVHTDGSKSVDTVTDGQSLDITPSFTPAGDEILFSSNRAGHRMQIWSISAVGEPGVTRMTTSESNDLWPSLDTDPKPRLFYQAMVNTRPDARIFMTPMGTLMQRDLSTMGGGTQPRVSPTNDAILFCSVNEKTGKRDVYRMSDKGGQPQNLTNMPDADDCDAVWSRDGRMIAFASDRGTDAEGRNNYDIWVLDLTVAGAKPVRITANGSVDDNPVFDPRGTAIYFRSNRGGEWGIWRVALK